MFPEAAKPSSVMMDGPRREEFMMKCNYSCIPYVIRDTYTTYGLGPDKRFPNKMVLGTSWVMDYLTRELDRCVSGEPSAL